MYNSFDLKIIQLLFQIQFYMDTVLPDVTSTNISVLNAPTLRKIYYSIL